MKSETGVCAADGVAHLSCNELPRDSIDELYRVHLQTLRHVRITPSACKPCEERAVACTHPAATARARVVRANLLQYL